MINMNKVCSFTGHRPQKLPWGFNEKNERYFRMRENTKQKIENAIKDGYKIFLCGMAIGFDMCVAEIIIDLKEKYSNIKIYGIIPCKNQESKWSEEYKTRYRELLGKLDGIHCLSDNYYDGCMQERNKFMIDNSSKCITLFDGKNGGTKSTIEYAKSKEVDIEIIEP